MQVALKSINRFQNCVVVLERCFHNHLRTLICMDNGFHLMRCVTFNHMDDDVFVQIL